MSRTTWWDSTERMKMSSKIFMKPKWKDLIMKLNRKSMKYNKEITGSKELANKDRQNWQEWLMRMVTLEMNSRKMTTAIAKELNSLQSFMIINFPRNVKLTINVKLTSRLTMTMTFLFFAQLLLLNSKKFKEFWLSTKILNAIKNIDFRWLRKTTMNSSIKLRILSNIMKEKFNLTKSRLVSFMKLTLIHLEVNSRPVMLIILTRSISFEISLETLEKS